MKYYSVAHFGSLVRPEYDKYSDKDLLIVGDTYASVKKIKEDYESQGYSVSLYTYKKLKYLSENGSLFLDHLKKEAVIIEDFKSKLSKIISLHISEKPTESKIKGARDYFFILNNIPNSNIGFAWFCDCFYVGLRNYLILKSAQNGFYTFSYLQLLEEFVSNNTLSLQDKKVLKELRVIKRSYRQKHTDEYPDEKFINKIIKIGAKLNLFSTLVNIVDKKKFEISAKEKLSDKALNHYLKLRLAEMFYYSLEFPNFGLEKIICNPQMYASMFKNQNFVDKLLIDLENKTAHNINRVKK